MEFLYLLTVSLHIYNVASEIRNSALVNKLAKVRPVGAHVGKSFVPLTEIPPPHVPHPNRPHPDAHKDGHKDGHTDKSGRRHLEDDCIKKPAGKDVIEGPKVDIFPDYYDDKIAKTVATVIFPDHIDHKHYEVTTQVPYLTLGPIEAIGYHPSTMKSEHPSECEKIYQDHLDEQYTEESKDYSEESLEMARLPLSPPNDPSAEERVEKLYSDLDI